MYIKLKELCQGMRGAGGCLSTVAGDAGGCLGWQGRGTQAGHIPPPAKSRAAPAQALGTWLWTGDGIRLD